MLIKKIEQIDAIIIMTYIILTASCATVCYRTDHTYIHTRIRQQSAANESAIAGLL